MPKFAANLSLLFTDLPFLDRFGAARAHGFEAVEFLFPYAFEAEQIAARLEQHKLQLVLHNLPAGNWDAGERGLACDPTRIGEFQDSVELALDYACLLGVPQLHCLAGIKPAAVSLELAQSTYLSNLKFAAAHLHAHGLRLLIEPINTLDIPGYLLHSSDAAAAIIQGCGAPNLLLQYDIYHMQRMGEDLVAGITRHLPLIGHMQLADVPGRHEPGTGQIDYPALFSLLDRLAYQGWIGCEYHPRAGTSAGLGWRQALSRIQ